MPPAARRPAKMAAAAPAQDVTDPPAPPPPARLLVEVVVSHDDRRRGARVEITVDDKQQRLIGRGYLRVLGTLDSAVPPFVATYRPGQP